MSREIKLIRGLLAQARGFSLVEILVALAVLAFVLVMTAKMAGETLLVTQASGKQIDASSMGRVVLDRLGIDLSGALLNGGATILFDGGSSGGTTDPSGNSALGFASKSRARLSFNDPVDADVRGIVLGYKIRNQATPLGSGSTAQVPLIARGDGTLTFAQTSAGYKADFSLWSIFGENGRNLPSDISKATSDTSFLTWQGLGDGVIRFHVTFLLDDGRMVQSLQQGSAPNWTLNATYRDFPSKGGTGTTLPIAFSAATSADPNGRYVKGMVVGVVVLDPATLRLAVTNDANYPLTLAGQLKRPVGDGETPQGVWQSNLDKISFLPVRQNIRFYQRFYPVTL